MIKYLGSKRKLVPRIVALAQAIPGARTALDLFTGTTRVAQGLKRAGFAVTANDMASYSEVLSQAYIAADARRVDAAALQAMLEELNALPGTRGYFTRTFCEEARYVQPANGMRVDAIRARIETITADASEQPKTHLRNFIDCVKTRGTPTTDLETGHISTTLCHLGNIAHLLGREVAFDPTALHFGTDAAANALLGREYRKGWELPVV